jgi:hypothetical protein
MGGRGRGGRRMGAQRGVVAAGGQGSMYNSYWVTARSYGKVVTCPITTITVRPLPVVEAAPLPPHHSTALPPTIGPVTHLTSPVMNWTTKTLTPGLRHLTRT